MKKYPRRHPSSALFAGVLLSAFLAGMVPASVGAAAGKPTANKSGKKAAGKSSVAAAGKKNGKKNGKNQKTGKAKGKSVSKKHGKKTASAGPRHHHSEKRVVAMKGNLPNVQSLGALVVDLETGRELFSRRPDIPRAIASISKLAATLAVLERGLDLDDLTTIKRADVEMARGGAKSRLLEGMTLSNRDLLHAALLGSDNRAISALGRAAGFGPTQFTAAMNHKVASLGLRFTRFREPTGLSSDNQSTPRETIELLKAAMAHPLLRTIVNRQEYDAHPVSKPPIHYINTHKPAERSNVQVLGGKTGYNDTARYCLVLVARIGGRTYGMSLLGTEGDLTRFGDVARVADWISTHKPKLAPSPAPQGPPPPEVILGTRPPDAAPPDGR